MKATSSLLIVLLTLVMAQPSRAAGGIFDALTSSIGQAFQAFEGIKGAFSPQAPPSEDQYAHQADPADRYPVEIEIYLTAGYMTVTHPVNVETDDINGVQIPVKGGSPDFPTPTGCFSPDYLDADHVSSQFKLPNGKFAPMPWSVFFKGGKALHQGNPYAYSHGCIHVGKHYAKSVFDIVKENGRGATRICIYE